MDTPFRYCLACGAEVARYGACTVSSEDRLLHGAQPGPGETYYCHQCGTSRAGPNLEETCRACESCGAFVPSTCRHCPLCGAHQD